MLNKNKEKKKSPYPENGKVRIRHSYYTFAREFPSKIMPLEGKRRKHRKKRMAKNALLCFVFIFLMVFSYFTVNLLVDISYADKDKLESSAETTVPEGENQQTEPAPVFAGENVRALYMPMEKLGDKNYIEGFVKQIKRKNCNSVLVDFKNSEGRLSYTSLNENAVMARAAVFDNNTVRQALDLFEKEEIRVIARIYCFTDNAAATANPSMAVKYMDTDVNWVDKSEENSGGSRLNPFSKSARKYIISIVKEVTEFKIDGILLEDVSFPTGENSEAASYPGEKKGTDKNELLLNFVKDIKKAVPGDCILLMGDTAKNIIEPDISLYYGSMLKSAADGFAVDTLERPENVTVDKKTNYASAFALFSSVKDKIGTKKAVYTVDISEYSASYIRKMKKAGYTDFIIYNREGIY